MERVMEEYHCVQERYTVLVSGSSPNFFIISLCLLTIVVLKIFCVLFWLKNVEMVLFFTSSQKEENNLHLESQWLNYPVSLRCLILWLPYWLWVPCQGSALWYFTRVAHFLNSFLCTLEYHKPCTEMEMMKEIKMGQNPLIRFPQSWKRKQNLAVIVNVRVFLWKYPNNTTMLGIHVCYQGIFSINEKSRVSW